MFIMILNEKNFLLFAARNYQNPYCEDMDEFYDDLLIPMHLKKLFTRYHINGVLKERLIINHIISLFNVFSVSAAVTILFYKIDEKYYPYLKTFLVYLERCPDRIVGVVDKPIVTEDIPTDDTIMKLLINI